MRVREVQKSKIKTMGLWWLSPVALSWRQRWRTFSSLPPPGRRRSCRCRWTRPWRGRTWPGRGWGCTSVSGRRSRRWCSAPSTPQKSSASHRSAPCGSRTAGTHCLGSLCNQNGGVVNKHWLVKKFENSILKKYDQTGSDVWRLPFPCCVNYSVSRENLKMEFFPRVFLNRR